MSGVDTREKRASACAFMLMVPKPVPDGTISRNDRQQITWVYAGIPATAAPAWVNKPAGLMQGVYRMRGLEI